VTDRIAITGLRVFGRHGVLPHEETEGQVFVVDVGLSLGLATAGQTDRLSDTIDYGTLARAVHDRVGSERWDLIERVAERVAELALEDPRVDEVEVTVHKPDAPIPLEFDEVAVTIRRRR
jgi:dihydroneopterin aldolase